MAILCKLSIGVCLLLLCFGLVSSTTFYVSPNGVNEGNNCTDITKPCSTIQQAVSQALLVGNRNNSIIIGSGKYAITAPIAIKADHNINLIRGNETDYPEINGGQITNCFSLNVYPNTLRLANLKMRRCNSTTDGGAITVLSGNVEVRSVIFDMNRADNNGAALFINGTNAAVSVAGSTFMNNVARQNGGAIHLQQGNLSVVEDTQLVGNTANNGGAISVTGPNQCFLSLVGVTIEQNEAKQSGGGLFFNNTNNSTTISSANSSISDNTAKINGGGVFCGAASVNITKQFSSVEVNRNTANQSANLMCAGCGGCASCDVCNGGLCQLTAVGGCQCFQNINQGYWTGANCSNCTQSDAVGHYGGDHCNICADDDDNGHWEGDKCNSCKKSWVGKGCDYQKFPFSVLVIVPCVCVGIVVLGYIVGVPVFRLKKEEQSGYAPI